MKSYQKEARATVSERGQVAIPKKMRQRLGIRTGQQVRFTEREGKLIITKIMTDDPLEELYGQLRLNRSTDTLIAELRGKGKP